MLAQLLFWRGNIERDLVLDGECGGDPSLAAARAVFEAHDDAHPRRRSGRFLSYEISDRPELAQAWVEQAGAAIRRLGGDDELEGERLLGLGAIISQRGEAQATLLHARVSSS